MKKLYRIIMMMAMVGLVPVMTSCERWFGPFDNPASTKTHISGIKITADGLENGELSIAVGSKIKLLTEIIPTTTSETKVNWVSSDETVATVSVAGWVRAISRGTVTITAVSKYNATINDHVTINVVDGVIDVNSDPIDQADAESRRME